MSRIQKLGLVYLGTVFITMTAGYLPLGKLTQNAQVLHAISQLLLALPALIYLGTERVSLRTSLRFNPMSVGNVILTVLLTFLIMPLLTFVNALTMVFFDAPMQDYMVESSIQYPMWALLLVVAVLPAILEETVYRGVFYNEYARRNTRAAIFVSALLFGVLHGNFNQFAYAFIMGMIFALVIEATNSILSTMIIHFVINAQSIVLLYLYPKLFAWLERYYISAQASGNQEAVAMIEQIVGTEANFDYYEIVQNSASVMEELNIAMVVQLYGLRALICTTLAFFVYRAIAKNAGRYEAVKQLVSSNETTQEKQTGGRLITIPLAVGIAVCVLLMVLSEVSS